MADKKRHSNRSASTKKKQNEAHSHNARLADELADELNAHETPDLPTDQASVASIAAAEPDTEVPGPSPEEMDAEHEPHAWSEAEKDAMSALDAGLSASIHTDTPVHTDMEASMEEDIAGDTEGVSRRNPQWSQDDVAQQTSSDSDKAEIDAEDATPAPGMGMGAGETMSTLLGATTAPWSHILAEPPPRRSALEEASSFFRLSGGPFPTLFRSEAPPSTPIDTQSETTSAITSEQTHGDHEEPATDTPAATDADEDEPVDEFAVEDEVDEVDVEHNPEWIE